MSFIDEMRANPSSSPSKVRCPLARTRMARSAWRHTKDSDGNQRLSEWKQEEGSAALKRGAAMAHYALVCDVRIVVQAERKEEAEERGKDLEEIVKDRLSVPGPTSQSAVKFVWAEQLTARGAPSALSTRPSTRRRQATGRHESFHPQVRQDGDRARRPRLGEAGGKLHRSSRWRSPVTCRRLPMHPIPAVTT